MSAKAAIWHHTTYHFGYEGDPDDLCTEVRFHFRRKIACSSIDSQCDDTLFFDSLHTEHNGECLLLHFYERRFLSYSYRCITSSIAGST